VKLFHIDAFAEKPFTGNPAAVCLLRRPGKPSWMQALASEMYLSETAFVWPEEAGWRLRWFTPTLEAGLCGHATLAAAHALWQTRRGKRGKLVIFHTKAGLLICNKRGGRIEMNFPRLPAAPCTAPRALRALGVKPRFIARGPYAYLVELADERAVRRLKPDLDALAALGRDVVVTARARGRAYDFVSRYFAPASGIPEDPVTGSAHCMLGPFWAKRLGKDELRGYQASRRGGFVDVRMNPMRVVLIGKAVTVSRGVIGGVSSRASGRT